MPETNGNTPERRAKIYALKLLDRLGRDFDVQTVNQVAAILPLVEGDIAAWLEAEMHGTVSRSVIVAGVRAGKHRPPYELKGDRGETLSRHNGDGSIREGEDA